MTQSASAVQIKPAFVCRVTPFLKGLSVLRGGHHNCTIHQHLVVRILPLSGQFMAQSAGLRARSRILAAVLALLAGTVPGLIHAQSITEGRVVGEVVSPQGAPIGRPQVTLLSQSTGSRISFKADYLGRFNLHLIAPGTYSVFVELAGYQPVRQNGVRVFAGRTTELRIALTSRPPPIPPLTEIPYPE